MDTTAPAAATPEQGGGKKDPFKYETKDFRHFGVDRKRDVEMNEVKSGYLNSPILQTRILVLSLVVLGAVLFFNESGKLLDDFNLLRTTVEAQLGTASDLITSLESDILLLLASIAVLIAGLVYYLSTGTTTYLIDFSVLHPDKEYMCSSEEFLRKTRLSGFFTPENVEFQEKILKRSGLGEETYCPLGIISEPPVITMAAAREEAEYVLGKCVEDLFARTGTKAKDIDILIINCSLFNPTPSLSAMVINKFGLRENVRNYNLAGMGCSAGVVSIDLAKDLLQVHRNSLALVISTENMTQNWYRGNDRGMLVSNGLFRLGGAAVLLSNKPKDAGRARYKLLHTIRIHRGSGEEAYRAVFQEEDSEQKIGIRLSKDLIKVVGEALKTNLTVLGPLVLPLSEQMKFFVNYLQRKVLKANKKPYTPDFKKAFQHYCIHAGGRAVIDGLEQNLKLEPKHVLPSRATLYRVGNTSSSSIWYELAFTEQTGRLKKGDRIWQIAFGSGFKCNSAVWQATRSIYDETRIPFWTNLSGLAEEYQAVLKEDRSRRN